MAFSENVIQVLFAAANTGTLAAGGTLTSDAVALSLTAVERELRVKVVPVATLPTSGSVEAHWQASGDVDADATADTDTQGTLVTTLDPTANPATKSGGLVTVERDGALQLVSTADQNVTVAVVIVERLWS